MHLSLAMKKSLYTDLEKKKKIHQRKISCPENDLHCPSFIYPILTDKLIGVLFIS